MAAELEPRPEELGPGLLEAVWRFRWLVVAVTLLAGLAGYAASQFQPIMYEARARVFLADPRNVGVYQENRVDPTRHVRNQAEFATSMPVLVRASELLRMPVDRFAGRVRATPSADLDLVTIRATDPTPDGAAALADGIAEAFQQLAAEEVDRNAGRAVARLKESIADLEARVVRAESGLAVTPENAALRAERDSAVSQLIVAQGRAEQISVDAALYGSGVRLFEPANLPGEPVQPRPARNAVVAAVLGLLAASAFAWWWYERTMSADSRHDAARILGAPLLGEVPEFSAAGVDGPHPVCSAPSSVVAEAYQFVAASLELALKNEDARTVLVTSAGPGDGKTVTALNVASAAVREGRTVTMVDADARVRRLTQLSGADASVKGLGYLVQGAAPRSVGKAWELGDGLVLRFVPIGDDVVDPARFFREGRVRRAIRALAEEASLTVIDAPPLLSVADTSAIAGSADAILLVVSRGTPLRVLEEVRARLDLVGVPLLGYVFNRALLRSGRYGEIGYGYPGGPYTNANGRPRRRGVGRRTDRAVVPTPS